MALPFNLRAFVASAFQSDADDSSSGSGRHFASNAARPSRAIHVPPDLVAQVRAHDVEAFRELVRLTYIPLVRFAKSLMQSHDEAEDIVQDVFTVVWDRGERWMPSGEPMSYLYASVRNHALNEMRRQGRDAERARKMQADDSSLIHHDDDLDHLIATETTASREHIVNAVLETLTERQRTAYDLRYRRGLTAPMIADVLAITTKSAEQLISRVTHLVLDRVREHLSRQIP